MELLNTLIKKKDARSIAAYIKQTGIALNDANKLVLNNDEGKAHCQKQRDFYDQRQLIKKILLNS
jgi:hypothetical protein